MIGEDERRIILLGKTGVGKSSVGNSILGEERFKESCSPESETQTCETNYKTYSGIRIFVIDTPGISDMSTEEQLSEIACFLVQCAPGPHVIIIVMEVGRQSRDDQIALDKLLKCFTGDVVNHTVLLFTHGYDLEENMTIQDFIHKKVGTQTLKDLAERCGNRIHVIDNRYWNKNSRDSDVLASLQGLSEQAIREITEKMPNTPAEETPWLNELSDQSVNVEAEKSEEQNREYRTNRYQLTQLMKSIKTILAETKGKPYTNKTLEKIGRAINVEVENILKETGAARETLDMEDIRRRARERVRTELQKQLSGVVVGTLLGALLGVGVGVAAPFVLVAGLIRTGWRKLTNQRPQAGAPPVQKADVGAGAAAGAGLVVGAMAEAGPLAAGAATGIGAAVGAGVLLLYGAGKGGASGYKESKTSDNPKQAADKAATAVTQKAGDLLKACWNVGNTGSGAEYEPLNKSD